MTQIIDKRKQSQRLPYDPVIFKSKNRITKFADLTSLLKQEDAQRNAQLIMPYLREYAVCAKIHTCITFQNVIWITKAELQTTQKNKQFLSIEMEYCEFGNLCEYVLNGARRRLTMKQIVYQIFNGVFELHREGIIHYDIKPDNIFVKIAGYDEDGQEIHVVRIADFGLSQMVDNNFSAIQPLFTDTPPASLFYFKQEQAQTLGITHAAQVKDLLALSSMFGAMSELTGVAEEDKQILKKASNIADLLANKIDFASKNAKTGVMRYDRGVFCGDSDFSAQAFLYDIYYIFK